MKDFRFYEEFSVYMGQGNPANSAGNVIAAVVENGNLVKAFGVIEALVPIYETPNSPVYPFATTIDYLVTRCQEVSRDKAKKIHPALFGYLNG